MAAIALCSITIDNLLSQLIFFPHMHGSNILHLLFTNHPELFLSVDIMDGTDYDAF